MSEEYTIVHQWDKVRTDFLEFMGEPYKYLENELKRILNDLNGEQPQKIGEARQDLKIVVDILEKLNSIYTPKLKRK